MTKISLLILSVSILSLSACGKLGDAQRVLEQESQEYAGFDGMQSPNPIVSADMQMSAAPMAKRARPAPAPSRPNSRDDNPSEQSYLAYRYTYGFTLPVKAVAATAKSHMQICQDAGADKCQVLGSNTHVQSKDYVNANLRLRAEPLWLETFRSTLISSVEASEGNVLNAGVSAEDLTRTILDTDARLKAQSLLRTRLEGLLQTRNAKLSELLQLERELARVQGDIESHTTRLKALRKRVSMSEVTINYQTTHTGITPGRTNPIIGAIKGFGETFSFALASVIDLTAAVLPWLILLIPGLWGLRLWWRKRRIRKESEPAKITR